MQFEKKFKSKTLCSLIAASMLFSSIPTCVLAKDENDSIEPLTTEAVIEETTSDSVSEDVVVEETTTVDENVNSIPTDETTPTTNVVDEIEEPPIVETTVTETTTETTVETTTETTVEETTTETTLETTEVTESTEPIVEEKVSTIVVANSYDEYFDLIAQLPNGVQRIIIDTTDDLMSLDVLTGVYYDGTYVLVFDSQDSFITTTNYIENIGYTYSIDGEVSVCGHYTELFDGTLNPNAKIKVAVIDTGSNNANEYYSVVGDDVTDKNGHGTDMCNYILNETDDAYLISIKAIGDDGKGNITDVYAAIQMAEELGVDYILMSISIRDNGSFDAFKELVANTKATIFASAGNNGTDAKKYLPAGIDNVMTVGSVDNHFILSTSNYGTCVEYNVVNTTSTSSAAAIALGYYIEFGADADDVMRCTVYRNTNSGYYYYKGSDEYFIINSTAPDNEDFASYNSGVAHPFSDIMSGWEVSQNFYFYYYTQGGRFVYCAEANKTSPSSGKQYYIEDTPNGNSYIGNTGLTREQCLEAALAFGPSGDLEEYGKEWWDNHDPNYLLKDHTYGYGDDYGGLYCITHIICDAFYDGRNYIKSSDLDNSDLRNLIQDYIDYILGVRYGNRLIEGHHELQVYDWWMQCFTAGESFQRFVIGGAKTTTFTYSLVKNIGATNKTLLSGQTYNFELWDNTDNVKVANGTATVASGATSANVIWSNNHENYPYAGPSHTNIYMQSGHTYQIMETTTSVNGIEIDTPSGWTKGSAHGKSCFYKTFTITINSSSHTSMSITNDFTDVSFTLKKATVANCSYVNGNSNYSFEGTVYNVYTSEANANSNTGSVGTFTFNSDGTVKSSTLSNSLLINQDYYIKETAAGKGYLLDGGMWCIRFTSATGGTYWRKEAGGSWNAGTSFNAPNRTYTLTVTDVPQLDPVQITLNKVNTTGAKVDATLNGAVFRVYYYAQDLGTGAAPSTATCWYDVPINTSGTFTLATLQGLTPGGGSNSNYLKNLGNTTNGRFPLGTIRIQEVTAPTGYVLNPQVIRIRLLENNQRIITNEGTNVETRNTWKHTLANNVLSASLNNTPEWEKYSLTKKVNNTNVTTVAGFTYRIVDTDHNNTVMATGISQSDGRVEWTYVYNGSDGNGYYGPDGALLTGTKTYEVILPTGRTSANPNTGILYRVYEDKKTITNNGITYTAQLPIDQNSITWANDTNTYHSDFYLNYPGATSANTITNRYDSTGFTVRKADISSSNSTARTFNFTVYYYGNGTTPNATGTVFATFNLTTSNGVASRTFSNVPTGWYGVVENNQQTGWTSSLSNDKINCTNGTTNTFTVTNSKNPTMSTQLTSNGTNNHVGAYGTTITMTDVVSYNDLTAGTYYVTGTLIDKSTGEPLKVNGNNVTAQASFVVPSKKNTYGIEVQQSGTINVNYTFNTTGLAGKTFVAYEEIRTSSYTGTILMEHKNINDANQTIYMPKIRTTLTDNATLAHIAKDGTATITDVVAYENLVPNVEYTISGVLMNKNTGATTNVTSSKIFKPTTANGTVEVTYTINRSQIDNVVLVAFETLKVGNTTVAVHEDINDVNQTIYLPKIGTTLIGDLGTIRVSSQKTYYELTDRISYTNLMPNTMYKVSGVVMVKETNQPLTDTNGNIVTTNGIFMSTPSGTGTTSVDFQFNADITDSTTLVVFEQIIYTNANNTDIVVAIHEDIDDVNQSLYIPDISTTFYDKDLASDKDTARNYENITLVDTVSYENIYPGTEYTLEATIMIKETNTALTNASGNPVKVIKTFIPTSPSGTVDVEFTGIDATKLAGKTLVCYETLRFSNFVLVVHADINDNAQTVHIPDIGTTLVSSVTNNHIVPAIGTTTVVDTVAYENLIPGKTYTLSGKLVYSDGSTVAGSTVTKTFVPDTANGTTDMTFTIDAKALEGKTLVAFEDLKIGNITIATHADLDDEGQTIYIPKIGTTMTDSETGIHIAAQKSSITLIDTVAYENVLPGSYRMVGTLYDASTGTALKDASGNNITASKTFTVTSTITTGTVDIEFTFDSSIYNGAITTVAYEKLYYVNTEIANHEEQNDKDQTVYIPDIKTTFYDRNLADDKDTATNAKSVTLVDTVNYENLVPGEEYTLTAAIMVKGTTPKALKDASGNNVVVTKTFTPASANGSVEVVFNNVDTTLCEGETLVCYETLTYNNVDLVIHADINDNDQTVKVPKIRTTLISVDTNAHIVPSTGIITVRDTVKYNNLVVGKSYTISGELMYSDGTSTGITGTRTFTATTADGSTYIDFEIDGSLFKNKTIVAFEDLKISTKTIATHNDLTDKDQTAYIPEISTTFVDADTNDHIARKAVDTKLVDTVTYKNLIPNVEYTITGTIYDKNTTQPIKVNGNDVVVSKTFKPTSANGTVDVEFTIDTTKFAGETFVCFESLTYGNVEIANHNNIDDVAQTIHVPDVHTTFYDRDLASDPDTARSYENITLVDEVEYKNLVPGKEYTLTGTIMVKDTTPYALKDADGNVITVTKTFTPDTANGTEKITFTGIDGKLLEGKTTVAFETLTYDGIDIVIHANIDDEDQTVKFPKIRTTLVSNDTGDDVVPTDETITLTDTVTYENLVVGKEYILTGKLVFADGSGDVPNVTTAPVKFTPTTPDGTEEVTFTFNSNVLKNKTLVAFEDLSIVDTKIATHADLTDENQTVYIPEIHTTLLDTKTKEHVSAQGPITVVDTVSCNNLVIGKEYTLNGILMNKKTGEPLKDTDGNNITATITWKAEAKDEIKSLEFTFDSSLLVDDDIEKPDANGTGSLVAFEELTHNDITVTTHNDLTDFDQSVYVPSVYTELFDEKFMDATDPAAKSLTRNFSEVNIVDKVYFKNLTPGYTYSLYSGLYIRESSIANMAITDPNDPMYMQMVPFLDANGDQYKTTITFDPEDTSIVKDMKVDPVTGAISGMIEVKYTIDATLLSGKHIVAFEWLDISTNSGNVSLVTHADPKNDYETVSIPEIGTTAKDKVDGDQMLDGTKTTQTVVDTIAYTGLVPGLEYVATGKLVIKKDYAEGEEYEYVTDKDGKVLEVSVAFTPDATNSTIDADTGAASGTIDVEFTFDASKYAGKYLVAFETVTYNGIEVAVHADITDETQTTKVPLLLHVKIAKMDGKNEKYVLKNAEITIYRVKLDDNGELIKDAEGNVIYEVAKDINNKDCIGVTDESGILEFTIMYDETYKYFAKETKAPRGYYLNEDYFEIIPNDTRESAGVCLIPITVVDFAIPPKTGDATNITLLATLSVVAIIVVGGGLFFIINKNKKSTNSNDTTNKE